LNNLLALLPYLRKHRFRLFLALLGTSFFTVLTIAPPLIIRYLIDHVIQPKAWDLLPWVALTIAIVPITAAAVRFSNVRLLVQTSYRFIGEMRLALYEKVLSLSAQYFGGKSAGMIVGRVMDDVNMLQRLLTANTIQIIVDVIVFIVSLSLAFSISWPLSLILCSAIIIYVFVYRHFSRKIKIATQEYRAEYDRITGRLQEMLFGVRQVRIFNREEWETEQFLDKMDIGLEKAMQSSLSATGMNIACNAITGFASAIIMSTGAYFTLRGIMTAGDLIAFNSFVWMAVGPAMNLTNVAGELQETFVSIGRILEILKQTPDVPLNESLPKMARGKGVVSFENVFFSYEAQVPLYRGLSLDIPAGKSVALVGPTGCGKTTLTSLLMRYWDVQSGTIRIDGIDIRSVNLKSLRNLFGVVLQTPLLFDGTLAENIAYGWPGAPREKIIEAGRVAEIHSFAEALPDGYDTLIGTYGVKLSVGEKQRVGIARAIVKDPLFLIMDEATSSLDSESEELIQRALTKVLKNRTSIIIAHRLTTITGSDMIVVIDKGAIVDIGTHDELMGRGVGLYRKLYEELAGHGGRTE
jgi:ABC-type multidrug transport system fused ATPase/permease subunit